jgi:hypothetical protein
VNSLRTTNDDERNPEMTPDKNQRSEEVTCYFAFRGLVVHNERMRQALLDWLFTPPADGVLHVTAKRDLRQTTSEGPVPLHFTAEVILDMPEERAVRIVANWIDSRPRTVGVRLGVPETDDGDYVFPNSFRSPGGDDPAE